MATFTRFRRAVGRPQIDPVAAALVSGPHRPEPRERPDRRLIWLSAIAAAVLFAILFLARAMGYL